MSRPIVAGSALPRGKMSRISPPNITRNAVAKREEVFQLFARKQDGAALVALAQEFPSNKFGDAHIEAAGRLVAQQKPRRLGKFSRQDHLLGIAARQAPARSVGSSGDNGIGAHGALAGGRNRGEIAERAGPPAPVPLLAEHDVFRDAEIRHQSFLETVVRHIADAEPGDVTRRQAARGRAGDDDLAGARPLDAGDHGEELVLAVARHAGDAEDLAAGKPQTDVAQPVAAIPREPDGLQGQHVFALPGPGAIARCLDGPADHHQG